LTDGSFLAGLVVSAGGFFPGSTSPETQQAPANLTNLTLLCHMSFNIDCP
jgi:hypothetical protein